MSLRSLPIYLQWGLGDNVVRCLPSVLCVWCASLLCCTFVFAQQSQDGNVHLVGIGPASLGGQLFRELAQEYQFASQFTVSTFVTDGDNNTVINPTVSGMVQGVVKQVTSPSTPYLFGVLPDYVIATGVADDTALVVPSLALAYTIVLPFRLDAVGTATVVMNLQVLANIMTGNITYWDDAAIIILNPGVTMPHQRIRVVLFDYAQVATATLSIALADAVPEWTASVRPATGADIQFPVASDPMTLFGPATDGSQWLDVLQSADGTLGYAVWGDLRGLSFSQCALKRNTSVVTASSATTQAALASFETVIKNSTQSDVYKGYIINSADTTAWPLCGLAYFVVFSQNASGLPCEYYTLLYTYLTWMQINDGAADLFIEYGYVPLTLTLTSYFNDLQSVLICADQPVSSESAL
eukprot:TRINITY_DN8562_c0_g1_i3.p1 TRINITY_DN8562_c0_g1~~TRINITY_DN8562_c0_g1_i3.p1  ORF type:complete len:411 (-),score=52.58 TRINITY_DN8562_c0_g1_i3:94-1326(-)